MVKKSWCWTFSFQFSPLTISLMLPASWLLIRPFYSCYEAVPLYNEVDESHRVDMATKSVNIFF